MRKYKMGLISLYCRWSLSNTSFSRNWARRFLFLSFVSWAFRVYPKMLSSFLSWYSLVAVALASTCNFKLEMTWEKGAPDGYDRDMIFINGQYPGPLLEIQQGDWVEIEVVNNMPFNTTMHAHGQSPIR